MKTVLAFVSTAALGSLSLYQVSEWWQTALATPLYSATSPDSCLRLEAYSPYWVLPGNLHRQPHPDPESEVPFLLPWRSPVFFRLYEMSSDRLLGESVVFEKERITPWMSWGDWSVPGMRTVSVDGFTVATTDRCASEEARLTISRFDQRAGEFAAIPP